MRRTLALVLALTAVPLVAAAQTKPLPPPGQKPAPPTPQAKIIRPAPVDEFAIRGFGTFGGTTFLAKDSFEAVLATSAGATFGGGVHVLLPWQGVYLEIGARRFRREGERAFVDSNRDVFRLGIPLEVSITPIEFTAGWRYRRCPRGSKIRVCVPRIIPYLGGGLGSVKYVERSDFGEDSENVSDRFASYHALGGVEFRLHRFIAAGGEVAFVSVPNAIGEAGVSQQFGEDNLGGTTLRVKVSVGF